MTWSSIPTGKVSLVMPVEREDATVNEGMYQRMLLGTDLQLYSHSSTSSLITEDESCGSRVSRCLPPGMTGLSWFGILHAVVQDSVQAERWCRSHWRDQPPSEPLVPLRARGLRRYAEVRRLALARHCVVLAAFRTEDWSLAHTVTAGAQHTAPEGTLASGHSSRKLGLRCEVLKVRPEMW